jgi:hypothetical protein
MANEFRTPFDSGYVAAIGRAIYIFANYEWTVVHTMEKLRPGFLNNIDRDEKAVLPCIFRTGWEAAVNLSGQR